MVVFTVFQMKALTEHMAICVGGTRISIDYTRLQQTTQSQEVLSGSRDDVGPYAICKGILASLAVSHCYVATLLNKRSCFPVITLLHVCTSTNLDQSRSPAPDSENHLSTAILKDPTNHKEI